jgi:putative YhdH/YhfP family quinone oxidoreductase
VVESSSSAYRPGDVVIIHHTEFGTTSPGGFSEYARVPAQWLTCLPDGLSMWQSMAIGTAGITAALCVKRLSAQGVLPGNGEALVTGATGGVGIFTVALLAKLGYHVVASSGKRAALDLLNGLGATEVIDRTSVDDRSGKELLKGRWAGVVDTVGGNILSTAVRSTRYGGAVVCCGNAAGSDLALTVYPFILRAVRLIGVDVAKCTADELEALWHDASLWPLDKLPRFVHECTLDDLDAEIDRTLHGQHIGRIVVNCTSNHSGAE